MASIRLVGGTVTRVGSAPVPAHEGGELVGVLATVRYHQNNFLIGILDDPGRTCVRGPMILPQLGLEYHFVGAWETHPKFGRQFVFSDYSVSYPTTVDAIREYLVDTCTGIGKTIATAIVAAYGADAIETLREHPDRVAREIAGLTADRAQRVAAQLREGTAAEGLRLALKDLLGGTRIQRGAVDRIIEAWKEDAPAIIRENPYRMIDDIRGVGFAGADSVAIKIGYDWSGTPRIRAGIIYALEDQARSAGHVCVPRRALVGAATTILGVHTGAVDAEIAGLAGDKKIIIDLAAEVEYIYAPTAYRDEVSIAAKVKELVRHQVEPITPALEGLAEDQVAAVSAAATAGMFILTGPPGTGKTFTVKRLVDSCSEQRVALAAPTGKAAKRMIELTGRDAVTVHRLLGLQKEKDSWRFKHGSMLPLPFDVIIIDEFSMMDTWLTARLLEACAAGTRVIFVGDVYQLPAVGAGNVLGDLIASGVVPCHELTSIKRQDPGDIVQNCHKIKDGQDVRVSNGTSKDFFFLEQEEHADVASTIVDLVFRRLPARYACDPLREIQVISPVREKTTMSCAALNDAMQAVFCPPGGDHPEVRGAAFRVGDKVIQLKNEYELGIINGDIGYVAGAAETEKGSPAVRVLFEAPARDVTIPVKGHNLGLAYAITCHKFQGSEAKIIVIAVHKSFGPMILQRNWVYTAISRAREVCVIVGQRAEISRAVRRVSQEKRCTRLRERLVTITDGRPIDE